LVRLGLFGRRVPAHFTFSVKVFPGTLGDLEGKGAKSSPDFSVPFLQDEGIIQKGDFQKSLTSNYGWFFYGTNIFP